MADNSKVCITIIGGLVFTLSIVLSIALFIKFYSSTYLCTTLERKIAKLENLMIHEPLLLQEAKAYLTKKIEDQNNKIAKLSNQTDKTVLANYRINLQDDLFLLKNKLDTIEQQLNSSNETILSLAKDHFQTQAKLIQKNIKEQNTFLAQIKTLNLTPTIKASKQEEIQEQITNGQKEARNIEVILTKKDIELIALFKNRLEEQRLILKKHILDNEKLSQFSDKDLLLVARKEQKKNIDRITKDIAAQQQALALPEQQIIQDAKNRINREILALKIKALNNQCK